VVAQPLKERAAVTLQSALYLAPALLLFTLFVALPMVEAAWYSLFRWNGYGRPSDFVGAGNFLLLLQDADFRTALSNNGWIIAVSLAVQLPLALALAVQLAAPTAVNRVLRLLFFLPYVLAEVAAGLIWRFLYDAEHGVAAGLALKAGLAPPDLLGEPATALPALLAVVVWKYFGFYMVLFIAGLQQIDRTLYEAARLDAATPWTVFRRITLPQLSPTIRLGIFFSVLGSLQAFDLVMALTRGGPSNSTHTMVSYLYEFGVTRMDIGFGSAVGVVLFVLCAGFAWGGRRWLLRSP